MHVPTPSHTQNPRACTHPHAPHRTAPHCTRAIHGRRRRLERCQSAPSAHALQVTCYVRTTSVATTLSRACIPTRRRRRSLERKPCTAPPHSLQPAVAVPRCNPHAGHCPRPTQTPAQCAGAERRRGVARHGVALPLLRVRLQQLRPLQRLGRGVPRCHGVAMRVCASRGKIRREAEPTLGTRSDLKLEGWQASASGPAGLADWHAILSNSLSRVPHKLRVGSCHTCGIAGRPG
jgi:hypothetical protein